MHSESEIRRAVKILLEAYGLLDTTEVKQRLGEVLLFDEEDLGPSFSRGGEPLILQRIGNVVSHQNSLIHQYSEGFLIDKNFEPAVWVLTTGVSGMERPIDDEKINWLKNQIGAYGSARYRKIDWNGVNERNTVLGARGEEFIYREELDKVEQIDASMMDRVQHLSAHQGDGFGYDILSVDQNGNSIFIEVKTTRSQDPDTPFYMSANELDFFRKNEFNNAFIYRVYGFDDQSRSGKVNYISAHELFEQFDIDPVSFIVYRKDLG